VRIGDGAQVRGSLKAHGTCHVGVRATVLGSLVAVGDVHIGEHAHVDGPVISERDVEIAAHATVGSPDARSSVVADRVTLCAGAEVFGLVSARRGAVTRCGAEPGAR
jgi:hypothetical protein